jgi:CRP/FNR family transcriptional regulator, anaerobic regulatory protein
MNTALIIQNINRHIVLTFEEEQHFIALLRQKRLRKRQYLLQEGEVSRQLAFVLSGCLRAYSIDNNGTEHILQFAPAEWWITDMQSLLTQQPATLSIDALEDTDMLLLQKTDQERLYESIPKFERFFRILAEKALVSSRQRLTDTMTLTAAERYQSFCRYYPSLIERLSQKQIAAYIGVTPEFLSKMLKEQIFKAR